MAYTKTVYPETGAPTDVTGTKMNKGEAGIEAAHAIGEAAQTTANSKVDAPTAAKQTEELIQREHLAAVAVAPGTGFVPSTQKGLAATSVTDNTAAQVPAGKLVLVPNCTNEKERGLWEVQGGTTAWKRPGSFASGSTKKNVYVSIEQGATYAGAIWSMQGGVFVKVDTDPQTWTVNSAGSGAVFNPQELGREEVVAAHSGTINLDLNKANVFLVELTGNATLALINIPTLYPVEVTVVVKQDGAGQHAFTLGAPSPQWVGLEPAWDLTANAVSAVQLTVLNKGTEIVGWAKAGGSATAPRVPVLQKPPNQTTEKGKAAELQLVATESPTSFSANNLPAGMTLNAATGKITGTPTTAQTTTIRATATNAVGSSAIVEWTWTVTASSSLAMIWGINANGTPGYALWQANGVHYMRSRYPGEARLGTDSVAEAETELVNAQKQAEEKGGKALIQIDVGNNTVTPTEYAAYALPLIKAVAAHDPNVVIELVNEPWEKGGGGGANAKWYGELVKKVYEEAKAKGVTLKTTAGGGGVALMVASRYYNKEWLVKLKEGLGGGASEAFLALNGMTSHPYGTLSLTEANGKTGDTSGNHNWATMIKQHEQAVELSYPTLATNNWWATEFGWHIRGSEAEETTNKGGEGEVPDEATRVKRYEEVRTRIKEGKEAGWLQAAFPYSQSDSTGFWSICNGEGPSTTFKAAGEAWAKTATTGI